MKRFLIVIGVIIITVVSILKIADLFRKNNFPIIERDFSYEVSITSQPLDKQQIAAMAKELAKPLKKTESEKKIVVSQAEKNNAKLKRFKGFLNNNLPDNWSIINSGNPDFIVTGYFFHPESNAKKKSALFLFLIEWETGKIFGATTNCTHSTMTTMVKGLIENLGNRQMSDVKVEVINKLQDAQDLVTALTLEQITKALPAGMTLIANDIYEELEEKLSGKQNLPKIIEADTTLIITEHSNRLILELSKLKKDYQTLAIKTNYTNNTITTACKNLIENLKKKPPMLEAIKSLHVAVIHAQPDAQFSTETALTLEEMVKAKPRLRLFGRNYTEEYHTQLREAMQAVDFSETAKEKLKNIAALSIEEDSDGLILELIKLEDGKLMATSVSGTGPPSPPRPFTIVFKAQPLAAVYIIQAQREKFIGCTPLNLNPKDIEKLRVREGTKFILKRDEDTQQEYIYPDDGKREDNDNMTYYTYKWYKD